MIGKIDIVIPFVNGNDPIWQEDYNKHMKLHNPHYGDGTFLARYDGMDILLYFFRSIEKNMPWINQIHLLLHGPSQVPEWLDTDKVHVVYHKDFIPEEHLPCFSSHLIEMWLWNIPNLSENFIYANDDFIINNPVSPEDFFDADGTAQNNLQGSIYKNSKLLNAAYLTTFMNSSKMAAVGTTIFPIQEGCLLIPVHDLKSCKKSRFENIFKSHEKMLINSMTMFRDEKNFNVYFFVLYDAFRGNTTASKRKYQYFQVRSIKMNLIENALKGDMQTLSLNDTNKTTLSDKMKLIELLNYKFPNKSRYEKC